MSDRPPLCRDCRHFRAHGARCTRIDAYNDVVGYYSLPKAAWAERAGRFLWFGKNRCGPEAQYFNSENPECTRPTPPPPHRG